MCYEEMTSFSWKFCGLRDEPVKKVPFAVKRIYFSYIFLQFGRVGIKQLNLWKSENNIILREFEGARIIYCRDSDKELYVLWKPFS